MLVNSNRPINFLLVSVSLIVVGCAETPKAPISYNDRPIITVTKNETQAIKSNNRFKTAQSHKGTVWERLLSLYSLPQIDNERVNRQLNWYLDHPAYIARIQQRAEPYLHLILDEIEASGIPGELALLPVVESAFIPDAYSKADASGLWQFIPDTGKLYGLDQTSWYDGRRDILDSTQAATAFLKDLGDTFNGDWLLALASYNWGKGNVWKAMEKNENLSLSTDYWSLDMPKETEDYVPRLLAIAKLFANADEYHIHLNHIPNKPYLQVVDIDSPLDLQKAAQLAQMPYDKFMKLNPGFNRASTSPDGPHRLLVPIEKAELFKTNLAQLPFDQRLDQNQLAREEEERTRHQEEMLARSEQQKERREQQRENVVAVNYRSRSSQTISSKYKVKSGETLTAIAARNNTTVQALLKANPTTGKSVRSGVVLTMPSTKQAQVEPIQWTAKSAKNSKSERIQVASIKNSAKSDKSDKNKNKASLLSLKVAVLDKKSTVNKKTSLTAQLAESKSQNYRKASVAIAKASLDTKGRPSKKLKRT